MSDNGLYTNIGFNVDTASVERAKAAVTSLGTTFAKTNADIERAKALENASKSFTQMALAENNAAAAAAKLNEELKALGATDKEIDKVVRAFDKEVEAIQRSEAAAAKAAQQEAARSAKLAADEEARIGKEFAAELASIQRREAAEAKAAATRAARLAKETADQEKAQERLEAAAAKKAANDAARLNKSLERAETLARAENDRLNNQIERDEIAARAENDRRNAQTSSGSSGSTGLGGLLQYIGREGRALPAVNIPGAGVSTDAISKIVGLSGALVDAASASSLVTTAASALTPVLGAQAAATVAAYAPAAAFVIAFAAIGAALTSLVNETSKNVDKINGFAESQRKVSDKAVSGSTSKDVEEENARLDERRQREAETLATLQKAYDDSQAQLDNVAGGLLDLRSTAQVFSGDEQALADQIAASQKIIKDTTAEYDANAKALEDGTFAANDARAAEEELTKARTAAALSAADTAGRDLAAQQKALANTEEGNKKRLDAIKDEQAVAQIQLDTLRKSGDTSAEVADKIAAVEAQLSGLGNEAKFIEGTALGVSRRADASKKAQKEIEDNEKKIASAYEAIGKAGDNYALKQQDIARQSAQRLEDIQRDNRNKLKDIDSKFFSDLVKLTNDARADEAKALRERNADEARAILDANRKLEDIRNQAIQSEQEAVNSRNFLQAAKIREELERSNKQVLEDYERGREDRQIQADFEAQERAIAFEQARQERYEQYRKELQDQRENLNRQIIEARIAKTRQLQEAAIAYQRELQTQQAFIKQYSAANLALYKNLLSIVGSAAKAAAGSRAGTSSTASANSFMAGGESLRPVPAATTNNSKTVRIDSFQINTSADPNDVLRVLERAGILEGVS